jgi:hypothetical protein
MLDEVMVKFRANLPLQEYLEDQWSWDKPVVVNGKEYPWSDGKVFK